MRKFWDIRSWRALEGVWFQTPQMTKYPEVKRRITTQLTGRARIELKPRLLGFFFFFLLLASVPDDVNSDTILHLYNKAI